MPEVVQPLYSIQYDGTNASYVCGTWNTAISLFSDNGTEMVFADGDNGSHHAVELGEWLVQGYPAEIVPTVFTDAQYEDRYRDLPQAAGLTLAAGYALTPTILASASANVAVNLDTAMSGTSYEVTAVLAGAASLLGSLAITAVAITDADTVTVTVQNNGIVSLAGATVIVCAGELV